MSGEVMANSAGTAIDDLSVLDWFEHSDLAQAITTHATASGILRMRQQQPTKRKRRSDIGRAHKSKTEGALPLVFDKADRSA